MAEESANPSPSSPGPVVSPSPARERLAAAQGGGRGSGQQGKIRGPYKKHAPTPAPPPPPRQLFTAAAVRPLVHMPFDMAAVGTGCSVWCLQPSEEAAIVPPAVDVLNTWVDIDPRYVSAIVLGLALVGVVGSKLAAYKVWQARMARAPQPAAGLAGGAAGGQPAPSQPPAEPA